MTLRYHPGPDNDAMPQSSGAKRWRLIFLAVVSLLLAAMVVPIVTTAMGFTTSQSLVFAGLGGIAMFVVVVKLNVFPSRRVSKVVRCKVCGRDVDSVEDLGGRKPCIECGG